MLLIPCASVLLLPGICLLNIVVLSHRVPYPPNKGEKIRTYNQLEFLKARGFKITVFCLLHDKNDAALAAEYQQKSGFRVVTCDVGFTKPRMLMGLLGFRALSVSNFYNSTLQKKLNAFLENTSVDAFYCTSSAMAEYVFQRNTADQLSPRMIVDFMDLDSDKWRQYVKVNNFPMTAVYRYEARALLKYEKKIQQEFDECIFISKNEVDLFQSLLPASASNLNVIGNGVDLSAFRPRPEMTLEKPLTLLFSGVMDYFPNENAMVWFVKNVWPILKVQHPDARLVIAGMNPSPAIVEMGVDNSITVTGFVDDMLECYHQANIFIAPFQIARGVQNKILQSFACGLPVVSTPVGAEGIDCNDGEHLMIADSAEEFVEKIDVLVGDKQKYMDICQSAITLVNENFTWDAVNHSLPDILRTEKITD